MMQKTVYIAGPMRGIPQYNFPAFDEAAKMLRGIYETVISPADLDREIGFVMPVEPWNWNELPLGFDFKAAQERDLAAVMESDAIYLLDGWEKSKGAKAELALAEWRGIEVLHQPNRLRSCKELRMANAKAVAEHIGRASEVDAVSLGLADLKSTNPKEAFGDAKLPLHLWPTTATAMGSVALLDGALKYGRSNWRVAGVRATTYIAAIKRHLQLYEEGENTAEDSGVPHLGHILACVAILIDAKAAGKLNDDRAVRGGYQDLVAELTPMVAELKRRHADKNPRHYTIQDNEVVDLSLK